MDSIYIVQLFMTVVGAIVLTGLFLWIILDSLRHSMPRKIPEGLPYYKQVPFDGDLFYAYGITTFSQVTPRGEGNLLGALLLKWLKDGACTVITKDKNIEDSIISFNPSYRFGRENEMKLYESALSVTNNNQVKLSDFHNFLREAPKKYREIFENILQKQLRKLKKNGIIPEDAKINKLMKLPKKYDTMEFEEEVGKILGFKKYLIDYSIVGFRGTVKNENLINFLIFAQLLGIENVVSKELVDINPLVDVEQYDKSVGAN